MNLTRKDSEDYSTFMSIVNKHCNDFKLSELSTNNFKCLIFVQELISAKDTEIRHKVLNKLENEPNQQIAKDCQIRKYMPRFEKYRGISHCTHKKSMPKEKTI